MEHPSKDKLIFEAGDHRYFVNKQEMCGATSFLSKFFPKFDSVKIAGFVATKQGKTVEEVLKEWDHKRDYACNLGTNVHELIEELLKGKVVCIDRSSMDEREYIITSSAAEYIADLLEYYDVIGTEVQIFSKAHGIAGTVDALLKDKKTGNIFIFDWKTNRSIDMKSKYYKKCKPPINHLSDCNYIKYCLQLNLYKRILVEEGYLRKIKGLVVIHFTPNSDPIEYLIPDMSQEIDILLQNKEMYD